MLKNHRVVFNRIFSNYFNHSEDYSNSSIRFTYVDIIIDENKKIQISRCMLNQVELSYLTPQFDCL